jgi:hypothetical protein
MLTTDLNSSASLFRPIDLVSADSAKLMNRFDVKYVVPAYKIPDILDGLPAYYRALEINGLKIMPYKTVYLDTPAYYFYRQHVVGCPVRFKVRFREYESTGVSFLEVKKRIGRWKTYKWRIGGKPSGDGRFGYEEAGFLGQHLHVTSEFLTPVLMNRFCRMTLVGTGFTERVTVDLNLSFEDLNGNNISYPHIAIVELKKQGPGSWSPIAGSIKKLQINPTGFSKYCIGVSALNDIPLKKLLNEKFLQIKRIENDYDRHYIS